LGGTSYKCQKGFQEARKTTTEMDPFINFASFSE
jgi:hypothetical protein